MRIRFVLCLFVGFLSLPIAFAQGTGAAAKSKAPAQEALAKPEGCAKCATAITPDAGIAAVLKTIPGTHETMPVGQVENLIPIGVLTVLGCQKCSAEAVGWALQQGSTFADIERTLKTVAAMQKLDCFKNQFGPDVISRMEKPLAAAKEALEQARECVERSERGAGTPLVRQREPLKLDARQRKGRPSARWFAGLARA